MDPISYEYEDFFTKPSKKLVRELSQWRTAMPMTIMLNIIVTDDHHFASGVGGRGRGSGMSPIAVVWKRFCSVTPGRTPSGSGRPYVTLTRPLLFFSAEITRVRVSVPSLADVAGQ